MENNKFINKYTKSILEGLGYEILPEENNNKKPTIIKKETNEPLTVEEPLLVFFIKPVTSFERMTKDPGAPIKYKDPENNIVINLSEYGRAELNITDSENKNQKTTIKIDYQQEKYKMNITILDENNNKQLIFTYYGTVGGYNLNNIKIKTKEDRSPFVNFTPLNNIKWGDYYNQNTIENFSIKNVSAYLINKIKEYNHGEYWTPEIRKGIELISPAIAIYISDFKKDWQTNLERYKQSEIEHQNEKKKKIEQLQAEIEKSENFTDNVLSKAIEQLEVLPPKTLVKK